jgi:hypothetical protein
VTAATLPDNILLDVFDFYRMDSRGFGAWAKAWQTLVHVSRRWRYIAFGSPRRLQLYLFCTGTTPVRKTLDVWPPLPIEISALPLEEDNEDNIIAALEQHDRIREVWLELTSSPRERFDTTIQESFPALEVLQLWSEKTAPALPDKFLGGSAPRLRYLYLFHIPFPGLPKLLLSCNNIVDLYLYGIPNTGYFSPEAMITSLSALTRLKALAIEFESPDSRPDRRIRRPHPLTRAVLPSLTRFHFRGVSEYLEDLVARIDASLVQDIDISFFNQLVFDLRQLPQFIHHAGMSKSYDQASVIFGSSAVEINFYQPEGTALPKILNLGILCGMIDWQVSSIAQLCSQSSTFLSSIEQLSILSGHFYPTLQVDADTTQWVELFHLFTAARTLRVSARLRSFIVSVLEEFTGELATGVFPVLESLYLEGYEESGTDKKAIEPFITARQCSDHPITVYCWDRSDSK